MHSFRENYWQLIKIILPYSSDDLNKEKAAAYSFEKYSEFSTTTSSSNSTITSIYADDQSFNQDLKTNNSTKQDGINSRAANSQKKQKTKNKVHEKYLWSIQEIISFMQMMNKN